MATTLEDVPPPIPPRKARTRPSLDVLLARNHISRHVVVDHSPQSSISISSKPNSIDNSSHSRTSSATSAEATSPARDGICAPTESPSDAAGCTPLEEVHGPCESPL